MKTCMYKIGRRPEVVGSNVYPLIRGYVATPTWVIAKDGDGARLPWSVFHVETGAYVWMVNTKREAEWLALALGETPPFDVAAARAWAKAQYELEDANKKLAKAKAKEEAT